MGEFVKTIEKVLRLYTVLIFFLRGIFEDMGIYHVFIYLSVMDRYIPPSPIKTKLKYVKNAHIFKDTT